MRRGQDGKRKNEKEGDGFDPDRFALVHTFW